jgi:uncharacterized repeat protein (TIGR01451 family)
MKRWLVRLVALSAVTGGGWFAVTWAQQHLGAQNTPAPDFSKPPVNAEAAAAWNAGAAKGSDSPHIDAKQGIEDRGQGVGNVRSNTAPSDPFQRVALTAGEQNAQRHSPGGDRYGEPRRLDADPNAMPLAANEPSNNPYRNIRAAQDDIPSPGEAGLNNSRGVNAPTDEIPHAPADPLGLQAAGATVLASDNGSAEPGISQQTAQPATNGLRIVDEGARQAGIATATGTLEAVNESRNAAQNGQLINSDRYGHAIPTANDLRRLDPPNDVKTDVPAAIPFSRAGSAATASSEHLLGTPLGNARGDRSSPGVAGTVAAMVPGLATAGSPSGAYQFGNASMPAGPPSTGATTAPVNVEGLGRPGEKRLEGPQNPSVTIEKIAPPEIQVNKPATFQVVVRNSGPVPAENVEVTDVVPQGTQLISTTPKTTVGQRGEILWKVGDLKPNEEAKLQVDLMPLAEGEIGSTAVVQFRSTASMRTIATKPEVVLELTAPKQVMIAEDAKLKIKLSNPGTGAASKVVLQAKIPPGFQHPAGNELEFDVGQFKPGETRDLDLTLHAVQAGQFTFTLAAQGDANLRTEKSVNIEVIAPAVQVQVTGPGLRYLERQAKYTLTVSNPGTAAARDINLTARLPKGMQFVEASDSGRYDVATNSVMWALDELPPGQSGAVSLTTLAKDAGEQKLRGEVRAAGGLSETTEQVTMVEGVAAVLFTVADIDDPVEVGGNATYEIHVVNQGSKAANRLQIAVDFPPQIKPMTGDGPSRPTVEGQRMVFEPMSRLAPKADITYKVVGQCLAPGDLRVQVLLKTDEMEKPVVKEESTRVYKD